MKTCPKCKLEKPFELFGKNRSKKDGLESWCKSCKYSARKAYAKTDRGKAVCAKSKAKYWATEKGKAVAAKKNAKYDAKNRKKRRALWHVYRQLKLGNISREPCEVCGEIRVQAHHSDYSQPLVVNWLCQKHHIQWHKDNGEGLNP